MFVVVESTATTCVTGAVLNHDFWQLYYPLDARSKFGLLSGQRNGSMPQNQRTSQPIMQLQWELETCQAPALGIYNLLESE